MRQLAIAGFALVLAVIALVTLWPSRAAIPPGPIVFLGDSITAGYGLDQGQAYPALIDLPGMTVVNLGVPGSETDDGLQRLKDYFAQGGAPKLIVVALGANDILHGVPRNVTLSNLNSIASECAQRHIPVLLCGVKIPGQFDTDNFFKDLVHRNHLPLLPDILQGEAFHQDLMQEDHMHPTAEGQKLIANAVKAELLKHFSFNGPSTGH